MDRINWSCRVTKIVLIIIFGFLTVLCSNTAGAEIKPFKVLVVIGDQWEDQTSFLVNHRSSISMTDTPNPPRDDGDFSCLIIMLKNWGIPFEIVRLDQEFMNINRFIGLDGEPQVGCIIWDVNQTSRLQPQRYEVLKEAVEKYGISLIGLGDRAGEPIAQELLGIKISGYWQDDKDLRCSNNHFITKGLENPLDSKNIAPGHKRIRAELTQAECIIEQGNRPLVTVRQLPSGAKMVWIGCDSNLVNLFSSQQYRTLFRRAITWALGYCLFKTWENKAWMVMDDPGGAQNAWLKRWHYPTLTEEQIDKYLIKPLKDNKGILVINVIPGFVNDNLRRTELSFQSKFTDEFGTFQDCPSTLRGLLKGQKAGVFEISSHGLTHMEPDLWSSPGPWFGAALDKERAEVGWYREFGDTRRGKEIPAAEALWRMKTGIKWLEFLFGTTPLSFAQGGDGVSFSYPNNTWRLAAQAGFGWYCWAGCYLGTDMAICGRDYLGTMECPLEVGALPNSHDKGITENPEQFATVFKKYPGIEWIGLKELTGYTHAKVSGGPADKGLVLRISYEGHYCQHFKEHPSEWNFLVSDWLAKGLGKPMISVNVKKMITNADLSIQLKIKIPEGLGTYSIHIN